MAPPRNLLDESDKDQSSNSSALIVLVVIISLALCSLIAYNVWNCCFRKWVARFERRRNTKVYDIEKGATDDRTDRSSSLSSSQQRPQITKVPLQLSQISGLAKPSSHVPRPLELNTEALQTTVNLVSHPSHPNFESPLNMVQHQNSKTLIIKAPASETSQSAAESSSEKGETNQYPATLVIDDSSDEDDEERSPDKVSLASLDSADIRDFEMNRINLPQLQERKASYNLSKFTLPLQELPEEWAQGSQNSKQDACGVCLESLETAGQKYRKIVQCGHVFHEGCMRNWFQIRTKTRTCPQCHEKLTMTLK